jgi:ribosomal protein L12E/L44/L45/RPP1/RPP2
MKTISRVIVLMAFLIAGTAVGSFAQQEKPKKEKKEKEKKEKEKKEKKEKKKKE